MFAYGWSALGLLVLSFYPMGSFVLRVDVDSYETGAEGIVEEKCGE